MSELLEAYPPEIIGEWAVLEPDEHGNMTKQVDGGYLVEETVKLRMPDGRVVLRSRWIEE